MIAEVGRVRIPLGLRGEGRVRGNGHVGVNNGRTGCLGLQGVSQCRLDIGRAGVPVGAAVNQVIRSGAYGLEHASGAGKVLRVMYRHREAIAVGNRRGQRIDECQGAAGEAVAPREVLKVVVPDQPHGLIRGQMFHQPMEEAPVEVRRYLAHQDIGVGEVGRLAVEAHAAEQELRVVDRVIVVAAMNGLFGITDVEVVQVTAQPEREGAVGVGAVERSRADWGADTIIVQGGEDGRAVWPGETLHGTDQI